MKRWKHYVRKKKNMENTKLKIIVALLAFALGVISTVVNGLSFISMISLLVLFGIPLIIVGIVIYHGAILKNEWRPFIGKGFFAIFIWFFPSAFCAVVNLIYWIEKADGVFYHTERQGIERVISLMFPIGLTIIYASFGVGICLWVKRNKIREHWLLRKTF